MREKWYQLKITNPFWLKHALSSWLRDNESNNLLKLFYLKPDNQFALYIKNLWLTMKTCIFMVIWHNLPNSLLVLLQALKWEAGLFNLSMYQEIWQVTSHFTSQAQSVWSHALPFRRQLTSTVGALSSKPWHCMCQGREQELFFFFPVNCTQLAKLEIFRYAKICQLLFWHSFHTFKMTLDIFFNRQNIFHKKDIRIIILEIHPQI